jgi:hypothetical protein
MKRGACPCCGAAEVKIQENGRLSDHPDAIKLSGELCSYDGPPAKGSEYESTPLLQKAAPSSADMPDKPTPGHYHFPFCGQP